MRRRHLFSSVLIFAIGVNAQVGIGTTMPNGALDINSNSQGIILPRVALTATNVMAPVTNPSGGALVDGTTVYNTANSSVGSFSVVPGIYYWESANWILLNKDLHDSNIYGVFTSSSSQNISNSSGELVAFGTDVIAAGSMIIYDPIHKNFTLPAGRKYRIDFAAGWLHFINGTYLRFALYNDAINLKISASAHCESVTNNAGFSGSANFTHFITVGATPLVISVRTVGGNTTNTFLGDSGSGTAFPTISIQSIN